jgi:hypothetical protein
MARITSTTITGSANVVGIELHRNTDINTDWRINTSGAFLNIARSFDDFATVQDLYQFQGPRFIPIIDGGSTLGSATNRWSTVFATNGVINTSDARDKRNIRELEHGLNSLLRLRPVSYEWKDAHGEGTKLGLIAQELKEVVPEVVRDWEWKEDEQGNLSKVPAERLGVYYSDLIPVLIKAVQEQQAEIEQLRSEVQQLRNER